MENEEIRSTGFRYTEDNVTFTSVKNPSTLVPNVLGRRGRWTSNGESIPNIDNEKTLINAVDIDWNGIEIDNNTLINTTADLINYIKNKEGQSSTPDTPLNQTISYTISCYRWYKEDITNPIAPKDDNNLSPEANDYLNSPNQAFPETKWAQFAPNRPSGNNWILWLSCSEITKNLNNNTYSTTSWQPPFQITGATGTAGEDNFKREYIYKRFTNELTFGNNNNNPAYWAIQLQDDYFTGGWIDNPQGVTEQYPFEYCAYRTKENGVWGKFSTPNIWSHYGVNGTDGDGIEYVFVRTNVNKAPFITIGINDNLYEDEYRPIANLNIQTSVSLNDNLEEQIPHISGGEPYENDNFAGYSQARCSDNPIGVDNIYRYEWVLQRKKKNGVWLSYANINPTSGTQYMSLWAVRGQDGKGDTISIIDGEIYINGEGTGVVIDNPDGTGSKVISLNSLSNTNYEEGQLGLYNGHLYVLINGQWVSVGESSGTGNYVHIAYADNVEYNIINNERVITVTNPRTGASAEPKNWLGICANNEEQDPGDIENENDLNWAQYKWQWLKGADGKDREFIFCLTKQNTAPGIDNESDGITGTYPNYHPINKEEDEFYPKVTGGVNVHGSLEYNGNFYWTDDPIASVSSEFPYLWWANRVKVNGVWSNFGKVTRVSGDPIPQIKEEWEAWSNISDLDTFKDKERGKDDGKQDFRTAWSVTTPSRPGDKPDFIHLWRRTKIKTLKDDGTYDDSLGYTYVRITGTNGTSIDIKGTVKKIYPISNDSGNPNISDLNVGDLFIIHGDEHLYKKTGDSSYSSKKEVLDGDSYVIDGPCEDPVGTNVNVKGDLYIWLDEKRDWVNIGKFTPENGKTYYTHVAWAESVTLVTAPNKNKDNKLVNDFGGNANSVTNATIYPNPNIDYAYSGIFIDETPIDEYNSATGDWWRPYIWTKVQGPPGTDGRYKEYIYGYASSFSGTDNENLELNAKRTGTVNINGLIKSISGEECLNYDDFIPNGYTDNGITFDWSDNPRGVRNEQGLTVEYQAYRRYNLQEKRWGDFSKPTEYSRWGKDGKDGDGLEYIFYAANEGEGQPIGNLNPAKWDANQNDDYLGPSGYQWSDDPIDLKNNYNPGAIEWVSIRKKKIGTNGKHEWQKFCEPKVWSRLAKDGVANGYTVDLSNENMPIGTDSDGNVPKGEFKNTCKVQVYHNGTLLLYTDNTPSDGYFHYEITVKGQNDNLSPIKAEKTSPNEKDVITVSNATALSNFAGKNAYIDINISLPNGATRVATITLFGVANGEPGKAIDLWTDASVIHENNSGNLTPSNLLVGVKVGTNITYAKDARNNNYKFKWNYTELNGDGDYIEDSDYINLESGHSGIALKMYYDSNLIDAETIPYVKDGSSVDHVDYYYTTVKSLNGYGDLTAENYSQGWSKNNRNSLIFNSEFKYMYCLICTVYTSGRKEWGDVYLCDTYIESVEGDPAYSVVIEPSVGIFEETDGTNHTVNTNNWECVIGIMHGDNYVGFGISTPGMTNYENNYVKVTINQNTNPLYDESCIILKINKIKDNSISNFTINLLAEIEDTDNLTIPINIPIYINRVGTWKEEVKNGVKSETASILRYVINGEDNTPTAIKNEYQNTRNAIGLLQTWSELYGSDQYYLNKEINTAKASISTLQTNVNGVVNSMSEVKQTSKKISLSVYGQDLNTDIVDGNLFEDPKFLDLDNKWKTNNVTRLSQGTNDYAVVFDNGADIISTSNNYVRKIDQAIADKVEAGKWYTMNFYTKAYGEVTCSKNTYSTSWAGVTAIWVAKGHRYNMTIYGYPANSSYPLSVRLGTTSTGGTIIAEGSISGGSSASPSSVTLSFDATETKKIYLQYKATSSSYRVYITKYSLNYGMCAVYFNNSSIDTSEDCRIDGKIAEVSAKTANFICVDCGIVATQESGAGWVKHSVTFKTASSIKSSAVAGVAALVGNPTVSVYHPLLIGGSQDEIGLLHDEAGLKRTGIDIEKGKITAVTDNFEIQNSSGDTTFSIDQDGNIIGAGDASFEGTIKSKNFYHSVLVHGQENIYYCTDDNVSPQDGHTYPYVKGHYYKSSELDTYWGNTNLSLCTGSADIIAVYGSGASPVNIYLPIASDYDGKLVEIVDTRYTQPSGQTYVGGLFIQQVGGAWKMHLSFDDTTGREYARANGNYEHEGGNYRFLSYGGYWVLLSTKYLGN